MRTPARSAGTVRRLARLSVVLVAMGCLVLPSSAATAHPFGAPAIARVNAYGKTVTVLWSAADDDLVALGRHVGAFDGAEQAQTTGAQLLVSSPAVKDYIGAGITVLQDGERCFRHPADIRALATTGARVVFTCAEPVSSIDVDVALLTDIDTAYRTVLVGESGAQPGRAMATSSSPVHAMTFEASRAPATLASFVSDGRLITFFDAGWGPLVVIAGLLVGAAHAMAPGHGKALAAAYLVGRRGRRRDALVIGTTVAAMHTASVLVLALVWYALAENMPSSAMVTITTAMQLAAAMIIVGLGLRLAITWRRERGAVQHTGPQHPHSWSLRELGLVGLATGLLPSPSAFLVLTTGLLSGRAGHALLVVGAFGIGLAATVTGVGWAAIRGRDLLETNRWFPLFDRVAIAVPGVAAGTVLATGTVLSGLAVLRL